MPSKLAKPLAIGGALVGLYAATHMGLFNKAQAGLGQSKNYVVSAVTTDPGEVGFKLADKINDYQGKPYDTEGLESALTAILSNPSPELARTAVGLMRPIVAKNPEYALELALEATKDGRNAEYAQDIVAQTYANMPDEEKGRALRGFKPDIQRDGALQWELLSEAADRLEPASSAVIFRKSFGRLPPEQQEAELLQIYALMPDDSQEAVLRHAMKSELYDAYNVVRHTWLGKKVDGIFGGAAADAIQREAP